MHRFIVLLVVGTGLVAASGCAGPPVDADEAKVVLYFDDGGRRLTQSQWVTYELDDAEAEKLASFFPEMGRDISSNWAAGWIAAAQIEFSLADGRTVQVAVSPDYAMWNEKGVEGDHYCDPKVGAYLHRLAYDRKLLPVTAPVQLGGAKVMAAVVRILVDEDGSTIEYDKARAYRVTHDLDLRDLISYLQGLGKGRQSPVAGGWEAGLEIKFVLSDGRTIRVTVSQDYQSWSEGRGDWPLDPMYKALVTGVIERAQPVEKRGAEQQGGEATEQ